jgi:dihydrodipicolinate reductase (EC 1.3.1.26)
MTSQLPIPVIVNGAGGKMGREVIKAIAKAKDLTLFGAIDHSPESLHADAGELAGCGPLEVPITDDLQGMLVLAAQEKQLGVMVDFTHHV